MGGFIQCPHEAIEATCVGVCNCPCGPCEPTRKLSPPRDRRPLDVKVVKRSAHVRREA